MPRPRKTRLTCPVCSEDFLGLSDQIFCGNRCRNKRTGRSLKTELSRLVDTGQYSTALEKLRDMCEVTSDGCWLFPTTNKYGYGQMMVARSRTTVHRHSYEWSTGVQLDPSMPVHHSCSQKACCNPEHLQCVTPQENLAEMLERRYYLSKISKLESRIKELEAENERLLHLGHPPRSPEGG
ncbi:HNH endonuclease [Gordonia Phage JonJames]|nr:HNH endonuclease [Gordonia Phage JonJames]